MKYLIVGAGYFGRNLAVSLVNKGEEVIVLDKAIEKISLLRDIVSKAIQVDATDKEMLKRVVPSDIDQAIVSIGRSVESSLIISLLLKELGIKHIISKCHSAEHEKILKRMDIDMTIDPEKEMAEYLANKLVEPNIIDYLPLESGFKIVKARPPKSFQNKKLKELDVRNKYGVNIIGIKKKQEDGTYMFDMTPGGDTVILADDMIIVVGREEEIEKLF